MTKDKLRDLFRKAEVVRSNRKCIAVEIRENGGFLVRAPRRMTSPEILTFMIEHSKQLAKLIEKYERHAPAEYKFETGERFLYLGNMVPLVVKDLGNFAFKFADDTFYLDKSAVQDAPLYFEQFYKQSAKQGIPARVRSIAEFYNISVNNVKISSAQKRWGSCSSKGNVNIAWRLIMAKPRVIDAVIVHELVHRIHMNHSKAFYALVEKAIPDYKECDKWLNDNAKYLRWI